MKPVVFHFLRKLIIATLSLAILMTIVFTFFLRSYYIPVLPFLLLFVFGFTVLSFSYLAKVGDKNFGKFIRSIMAITVIRLFVYILITVLYAAFLKDGLLCFVIALGLFYLIFATLEVSELVMGTHQENPVIRKPDKFSSK
jgi:hypothetical protein